MKCLKIIVAFAIWTVIFLNSVHVSEAAFTYDDEKKLGKELFEKLEKNNALLKTPRVTDYLNQVGMKVLSQVDRKMFDYQFSVVKSSAINAFATPGGYVYVNSGLISLVNSEDELAGVLAHEIAHVQSRHIAQLIERSKKLSIATLAALLAGAFLGGGAGAEALVGLSLAGSTALSLKYSRENEEEADRIGLSYLTGAGYSGKGMLEFLKIMKNYEYYSNSVPSYFLTHPGTDDRIHYLDSLLQARYSDKGKVSIIGGLSRIQTLLVLEEKDTSQSQRYFQERLRKNPNNPDALYGLAVTQSRLGQIPDSLASFNRALAISPNDGDILKELGITCFNSGRTKDSLPFLRKAESVNQADPETLLYIGRALQELKDYPAALEYYLRIRKAAPDDVNVYYNLAMVYGNTGEKALSHFNFGIYFKKKKKFDAALFHLRAAANFVAVHCELGKDIQKEIASIEHEMRQSSGRNVRVDRPIRR